MYDYDYIEENMMELKELLWNESEELQEEYEFWCLVPDCIVFEHYEVES